MATARQAPHASRSLRSGPSDRHQPSPRPSVQWFGAILLAAVMLGGCSSGPPSPRMRLGSIPVPGTFNLYSVADPGDLGEHRSEAWPDLIEHPRETGRGILYTCRAGFLDLAHIRDYADIIKFANDRILERLPVGATEHAPSSSFDLRWCGSTYTVTVWTPPWWQDVGESERAVIASEAAIRVARRFAVIVGLWHELGTWYGQETIPPFSEQNSAFTWDDSTSHVVAGMVAEKALRDSGTPWDVAVTRALIEVLTQLGVVDRAGEEAAVNDVRGVWWIDGTPTRRDLDTGLKTGIKEPWLVPNLGCCPDAIPAELRVPDVADVYGRDMQECFWIRIRSPRWLVRKAMNSPNYSDTITTEEELHLAMEILREAIKAEFGPDADQP